MAGAPVPIVQEVTSPFQIGPTGAIASVSDVAERAREHLVSLLFTGFGERLMLPSYGSSLPNMLFENMDPIKIQDLNTTLIAAASTWLSDVQIVSVTPTFNDLQGTIVVQISYVVPGVTQIHTIQVDQQGQLVEL